MGNEPGNLNGLRSLGLLYSLVCLVKLVLGGDGVAGSAAVLYSADDFARHIPTKPHLVLFYAPWCGHCQRLMPDYNTLAEKYNGELKQERVVIAKVDCTKETALCSSNDVTGYPRLLFFWSDPNVFAKFKGKRDLPGLEEFVEKMLLDGPPKEVPEPEPTPTPRDSLYDLTDTDFASHIAVGHHFVKFFAPWCGHCLILAPTWEELGKLFEGDDSVTIAKVDCTKYGNICTEHSVRGYPTLIFFSHGKQVSTYQGARTIDALQDFVEKTKSAQDNLEKMAADEFVPDQKPADDDVASEGETFALELTGETFESHVSEGHHFVKFYAPWCGHCRNLAPIWDELAKSSKDGSSVSIVKVDCTKFTDLCKKYSIRGYPSLLFFSNGEKVSEYQGSRSLDDLKDFVKKTKAKQDGVEEIDDGTDEKVADDKETALELTDATFDSHISTGHHFIKFFAPWCGHCKNLAPTWDELAKAFRDDSSVSIAKVDCTKFQSVCKQYSVRGFPTLLFFSKGEEVAKFSGSRSFDELKEFVEKTKAEQDGVKYEQKVADDKETALELTDATFDSHISTGHHFIKFFAPWCGHCKNLAPIWDELSKAFQDDSSISIAKVDCTKFASVCSQYSVRGYPSLLFFSKGKQVAKYQGARTLDDLRAYAEQTRAEQDDKEIAKDIPDDTKESEEAAVLTLNEKSFEAQLEKGHTFVNFVQQGCKACESLEPIWLELGKKFKSEPEVVVAKVDCSVEDQLCRHNGIDSFPALVLYYKGDRVAEYKGPHDLNSLHAFVLQGMLNPQGLLPSRDEL